MSLQRRRERYIILQMWKILHQINPNDVGIVFRPESRLGIQAIVPSLNRSSTAANQSIYDRSFAVVGPKLWNVLPKFLTSINDSAEFKNSLTSYLAVLVDEPPVFGYTRRHNNTLLEVTHLR